MKSQLYEKDASFIKRMIKYGDKKGQIIIKDERGLDTDISCDWYYKNNELITRFYKDKTRSKL